MGWFKSKEEKELDEIIAKVQMNMSNNYKDNAIADVKELAKVLEQMKQQGVLKEKVLARYQATLDTFQQQIVGYSHKEQKPYWH
ncbi:MAG: hypothetical protein K6C69_04840 [Lachnospiraceae bacterium]|nr:hypothetical protein [Lachnospiraceae bacterium]